mgnify:CR=1 FL=1
MLKALAHGLHVFCEKPMAVDGPGVQADRLQPVKALLLIEVIEIDGASNRGIEEIRELTQRYVDEDRRLEALKKKGKKQP